MSELVEELDKLKNDFYGRMSDVVKNKKDVQNFNSQFNEITKQYLRKIEYILEDYGIDCRGKSIDYFAQEFMFRKK